MSITAKRGATADKTYTVSGKTLADIDADIDKKGPKDPNDGKRFAGSCLGKIAIDIKPKDIGFETKSSDKGVAAVAMLVGGSVTSTAVITTPKLASTKELSDKARKEWDRFMVFLGVHERGHADAYYATAVKVMEELDGLRGTGVAKTEKEAKLIASKALEAAIVKKYGGKAIDNLVLASAKAYDAKTKHGASQGATLDTSIA